jgi:hypothetical protein
VRLTLFAAYWILDHSDLALHFAEHGVDDNICVTATRWRQVRSFRRYSRLNLPLIPSTDTVTDASNWRFN